MQTYNRKFDTKNVETSANENYGSSYINNRGKYNGDKRGPKDWVAPGWMNEYEKSVWLINTFTGSCVKRRDSDSNDSMIRRFKRVVESAGTMRELKRREYYLTPSQKKREKKKRALKRLRKHLKAEQESVTKKDKDEDRRSSFSRIINRGGGDA